jgi:hypothetical protein
VSWSRRSIPRVLENPFARPRTPAVARAQKLAVERFDGRAAAAVLGGARREVQQRGEILLRRRENLTHPVALRQGSAMRGAGMLDTVHAVERGPSRQEAGSQGPRLTSMRRPPRDAAAVP